MLKMCLNRNVLIGLGVVALAVLVLAPDTFFAVLPFLVVLACPLSMVVMMRAMGGQGGSGDRCRAGSSSRDESGDTVAVDSETSSELVRLQAEVDQLRAELADKQPGTPRDP